MHPQLKLEPRKLNKNLNSQPRKVVLKDHLHQMNPKTPILPIIIKILLLVLLNLRTKVMEEVLDLKGVKLNYRKVKVRYYYQLAYTVL